LKPVSVCALHHHGVKPAATAIHSRRLKLDSIAANIGFWAEEKPDAGLFSLRHMREGRIHDTNIRLVEYVFHFHGVSDVLRTGRTAEKQSGVAICGL
jgi:hypothetical protein